MGAVATTQLTDKQQVFVELVTTGVPHQRAAELAGYTDPRTDAYRLMHNQRIGAAIALAARKHVEISSVLAVRTLVDLLDEKISSAVRLGAAKTLLDRAGITEKTNENNGQGGKALSEMTEDELLAAYRRVAEERARIDDSARKAGAIDVQAVDITGQSITVET